MSRYDLNAAFVGTGYFSNKREVIFAKGVQNPSTLGSSGTLNERLTSGVYEKQLLNKLHGILKITQAIYARTGSLKLQLRRKC